MSVRDFIDTNVFVYCFDSKDLRKRKRARAIVRTACSERDCVISYQVVQEFLNVATRKFEQPMTSGEASEYLGQILMPLCRVFPSQELYQHGLMLQARYQLSFYDALIVSGALQSGCRRLLSEDLQDGLKIDELVVENPF